MTSDLSDRGVTEFALREAPALLAARHERWFRCRRNAAIEHVVAGLISILGLLVLSWPAESMALFLLLGLLIRPMSDAVRYWMATEQVASGQATRRHESKVEAALAQVLEGKQVEVRDNEDPGPVLGPGLQLSAATWLYGCLVASFVYEINRSTGVDLIASAVQSVSMLVTMTVLLVWQVSAAYLEVKRELRSNSAEEIRFEPLLEALLYFIILFFWLVVSAILGGLAQLPGLEAFANRGLMLLVLLANVVLCVRGALELWFLGVQRRDLKAASDWLAAQTR